MEINLKIKASRNRTLKPIKTNSPSNSFPPPLNNFRNHAANKLLINTTLPAILFLLLKYSPLFSSLTKSPIQEFHTGPAKPPIIAIKVNATTTDHVLKNSLLKIKGIKAKGSHNKA